MDRMEDKLDGLFAEYRGAFPDPEPSAEFMPALWQRIEARRTATLSVFRRFSQVCVMATVALTLLMGVVLIPRLQKLPIYTTSYVDMLAAEHSTDYLDVLAGAVR